MVGGPGGGQVIGGLGRPPEAEAGRRSALANRAPRAGLGVSAPCFVEARSGRLSLEGPAGATVSITFHLAASARRTAPFSASRALAPGPPRVHRDQPPALRSQTRGDLARAFRPGIEEGPESSSDDLDKVARSTHWVDPRPPSRHVGFDVKPHVVVVGRPRRCGAAPGRWRAAAARCRTGSNRQRIGAERSHGMSVAAAGSVSWVGACQVGRAGCYWTSLTSGRA